MKPELGQEWFHKDSLAVATVYNDSEFDPVVYVDTPFGRTGCARSKFNEEYVCNEPVTPELLERMNGGQWSLNQFATLNVYAYSKDAEIIVEDACSIDVVFPETLRDLVCMLRVFGLKDSVTPAAT